MKLIIGLVCCILFCVVQNASSDELHRVENFLSEYIQYPSVTGNEKEAALYLEKFATANGFEVKMLHSDPGSYNLAISLYSLEEKLPNIILFNHIDVVKPGEESLWDQPPFSGNLHEGSVWGRGAIDNKGMAAMQLFAMMEHLANAREYQYPYNITMLSVSNEEQGGTLGAQRVVDDYFDLLNPVVVLGEGGLGIKGLIPSDRDRNVYTVSIAQKRGVWIRLRLEMGSSGHGSVPPEIYTNRSMIEALNRIKQSRQPIRFTEPVNLMFFELGKLESGFTGMILRNTRLFRHILRPALRRDPMLKSLVTNTISITDIRNPETSFNQIPQSTTAVLDCRLVPGYSTELFIKELRYLIGNPDIEIEIIKETSPSRYTRPDQYYLSLKNAILHVEPQSGVIPILFPANNDNNYFRAEGVPVYGILPATLTRSELESIHNVNERISVVSLEKGVKVYSRFLKDMLIDSPVDEARK